MHINNRYKSHLMLFIAFLAQNIAVGFSFGSIGLLIEPLSRDLNAKVALVSVSVALVALIASASSPVVGMLLDRWSLRATMAIGCVLCAAGYYCAAHSHSITMYLGSFAGVGLGFAMMGVIPANKIANIWFPERRGLAGGIVNIAALPALGPVLFQHAISVYGWRAMLEGFALINLGFVLLVWLIERPRDDASTESTSAAQAIAATSPFKTALFWKLLFAKGLLLGSGVTAITYLAPFALTQGLTPERAAQLLSIEGTVALLGALVFGWLCDRISPFLVLGINAFSTALMWAIIVHVADFNSLALLSAGIGLCSAGVMPMAAAIIGRCYPPNQFGSTLGQLSLATVPFTFTTAPLIGFLYDQRGNYIFAFQLEAILCTCVVGMSVWLLLRNARAVARI